MEYLHLAGDDPSRLAYFEILPDETRRGMTGNGVSFRSHRSAKALRRLKSSISAPDPIRQEQTERPNASCRPPCENGRSRPKIPAGEACWNGQRRATPNPISIPPNGPRTLAFQMTLNRIHALEEHGTERFSQHRARRIRGASRARGLSGVARGQDAGRSGGAARWTPGFRAQGRRDLSVPEARRVQRWIRDKMPDQMKLPFALGTAQAVRS